MSGMLLSTTTAFCAPINFLLYGTKSGATTFNGISSAVLPCAGAPDGAGVAHAQIWLQENATLPIFNPRPNSSTGTIICAPASFND
jgi:hypothetical protein